MKNLFISALLFLRLTTTVWAGEINVDRRFEIPIRFVANKVCLFQKDMIVAFNASGGGYASATGRSWKPIRLNQGDWKAISCSYGNRPAVAVTRYGIHTSLDGIDWQEVKDFGKPFIVKASVGADGSVFVLTDDNKIREFKDAEENMYFLPEKPRSRLWPDIAFATSEFGSIWYFGGNYKWSVWDYSDEKFRKALIDFDRSIELLSFLDSAAFDKQHLVVLASTVFDDGRGPDCVFFESVKGGGWRPVEVSWANTVEFIVETDKEGMLLTGGDAGRIGVLVKKDKKVEFRELDVLIPKTHITEGKRPHFFSAAIKDEKIVLSASAECSACPSYIYVGSFRVD